METSRIVEELDAEISRLTQVRNLLAGGEGIPSLGKKYKPGIPKKKRVLSAKARKAISDAQKKRWAKEKKATAKQVAK